MKRIRPHLTYANLISTLCLFMVLGGGAYAVSRLPKNSVGSAQIVNGAVTKGKLSTAVKAELHGPGLAGEQGIQGLRGEPGKDATGLPPGATIPEGVTLRGVVAPSMNTGIPDPTGTGESVSFGGYQLGARPLANVIGPGEEPTTACPGSPVAPAAASGNLCVYVFSVVPSNGAGQVIVSDPTAEGSAINYNLETKATTLIGAGRAAAFGFQLFWSPTQNTNVPQFYGSWAVTG